MQLLISPSPSYSIHGSSFLQACTVITSAGKIAVHACSSSFPVRKTIVLSGKTLLTNCSRPSVSSYSNPAVTRLMTDCTSSPNKAVATAAIPRQKKAAAKGTDLLNSRLSHFSRLLCDFSFVHSRRSRGLICAMTTFLPPLSMPLFPPSLFCQTLCGGGLNQNYSTLFFKSIELLCWVTLSTKPTPAIFTTRFVPP